MFCKIYITMIIDCHDINHTSSRAQVNYFFFFKKKGYEFQDKLKRSRGGERRRGVCWDQTTKIIGRRRRRRRRKGDQD